MNGQIFTQKLLWTRVIKRTTPDIDQMSKWQGKIKFPQNVKKNNHAIGDIFDAISPTDFILCIEVAQQGTFNDSSDGNFDQ